ncbi:MAG: type I DNA topoisomerase, partial [Erysipelotrichaceae bacterium]|nr:type I DNA topoisomerase [Erysipelotrichaceae bacterium]
SSLKCDLSKHDGKKVEIHNEKEADEILSALGDTYTVSSISFKKKKRSAFLPFITSTLQQEASMKLGFSSRKTMQVAQSLYEGVDLGSTSTGLITYMRTDSTRLSKEFIASAYSLIEREYGKEYKGFYRVKNDESSQDAHEAIRPTSLENEPEKIRHYLSNDQYKLYKFIYNRALASLMAEAVFNAESVSIDNNGYTFTINGSEMIFDGWLKVYHDYDSSKDVILPKLEEGEVLKCKEVTKTQHFTEAPARYTEAKLIKALEEEGVGRPSTYATIIDTIQKRGYVELKKSSDSGKTKFFFPTEQGLLTDEKLREYFLDVINVKYTAKMEKQLDDIASEKTDSEEALASFYKAFEPLVEEAYEKMEKVAPEKTGEICPECGSELVIRSGRFGKFISCSNYPKCRYHASLTEREEPVAVGRTCPDCGAELVKRKSRYGNYFIGCSNYPKCRYVESIPGEKTGRRFYRKKKA